MRSEETPPPNQSRKNYGLEESLIAVQFTDLFKLVEQRYLVKVPLKMTLR